jgi:hypothetical protein
VQAEATVANLRQQFSKVGTPAGAQQPLFASLQAKISALDAGQAATESAAYRAFAAQATGLAALVEVKSREASLAATYRSQLDAPEFAAFNQERRAFREQLLERNTGALDNAILAAGTMTEVKGLIKTHVLDADLKSAAAAPVLRTAQLRRTQLLKGMRTEGLNYADDIEALFTGDFEAVSFKADSAENNAMLDSYIHAYWQRCEGSLSKTNRVQLMDSVCDTPMRHVNTVNGLEVSGYDYCGHYTSKPSGVFADPEVYDVQSHVEAGERSHFFGDFLRILAKAARDPVGTVVSTASSAERLSRNMNDDMQQFLTMNTCASPVTRQFQANMVRFGWGRPPVSVAGSAP